MYPMMQNDARLAGRRILITGAARGIGAALARRLSERGARVGLLGLEPELLAEVAASCGGAPWQRCDVRDRQQVETGVAHVVDRLSGLDVVVANAGVGAQMPILGGDVDVMTRTLEVNLLGTYYTLRAAAPHVGHAEGYALAIASAAAAAHLPLMGAYSASKAGVEALGNTLRIEMSHLGTKVGVGYLGEIDTDMTSIGFSTQAARKIRKLGAFTSVAPLEVAVRALVSGIAQRKRRVYAPRWVGALLPLRSVAQRLLELRPQPEMAEALRLACLERAPLTTEQPGG
jgi:NAD(P)-dependent dehydrogenase (short-subunit alcohol dehydrogenase family)